MRSRPARSGRISRSSSGPRSALRSSAGPWSCPISSSTGEPLEQRPAASVGEQRQSGLEAGHFGRQLGGYGRIDVGRIADQEVEAAQLERRVQVGGDQLHPIGDRLGATVRGGERQGGHREVGADDTSLR